MLRERLGIGQRVVSTGYGPGRAALYCLPPALEGGPPIHTICDVAKHGEGFQGDLKFHHLCLLLQFLMVGWGHRHTVFTLPVEAGENSHGDFTKSRKH